MISNLAFQVRFLVELDFKNEKHKKIPIPLVSSNSCMLKHMANC